MAAATRSAIPLESIWGAWRAVLTQAIARGYAVAAITYGFKKEASFPAQLEDTLSALKLLRGNADLWTIDRFRVYVWDLSAGVYLTSLLGMRSGSNVPDEE